MKTTTAYVLVASAAKDLSTNPNGRTVVASGHSVAVSPTTNDYGYRLVFVDQGGPWKLDRLVVDQAH